MCFQKSISYKNPRHGAPGTIGTSKSKRASTATGVSKSMIYIYRERAGNATRQGDKLETTAYQGPVVQASLA